MEYERKGPEKVIFIHGPRATRASYYASETLLDTARRAGIAIHTGCEKGDCGTCIVELLKGEVCMRRNMALTGEDVASGCVLACQAVPVSDSCEVEIY